jgi:hypothetical protein
LDSIVKNLRQPFVTLLEGHIAIIFNKTYASSDMQMRRSLVHLMKTWELQNTWKNQLTIQQMKKHVKLIGEPPPAPPATTNAAASTSTTATVNTVKSASTSSAATATATSSSMTGSTSTGMYFPLNVTKVHCLMMRCISDYHSHSPIIVKHLYIHIAQSTASAIVSAIMMYHSDCSLKTMMPRLKMEYRRIESSQPIMLLSTVITIDSLSILIIFCVCLFICMHLAFGITITNNTIHCIALFAFEF